MVGSCCGGSRGASKLQITCHGMSKLAHKAAVTVRDVEHS